MTSDDPVLNPAGTFMGVPAAGSVRAGQAAIIGMPFDCGTHPTRIGARQGPAAIRAQSGLLRPFYPPLSDSDVLRELSVVDIGDVRVSSGDVEGAFPQIERAIDAVVGVGAYPVTMGGDGAVTLPQLRGVHRHHSDLVVLHIDAHTDSYDTPGYNTGSTFTRAAEERVVDPTGSFHIGARGSLPAPGVYAYTRSLGYNLVPGEELRRRGEEAVLSQVRETVAGRPVYLCFDMDYIDPSAAPGVATPTWGGPDAEAALRLLHGLAGLNLVAVDVNTVSPPHDVGGMTACLAAHVMLASLHLVALGRHDS
ncbi:arginase family protein [Marivibrio halodurans]|uniref:Arginase family protein n=1 Tax=Marivibrio halodurans TaxID=2039722 RepID=A0A8J7SN97_9PROT|nr:arginase family protein [Marivibrio halodurans]MBP5857511.1 arginase family protein [Marivibrio halodurans]